MPTHHRRFLVARRPVGVPQATDFQLVTEPLPVPGDGEVLVRADYLSLDPAMRGWMSEARSYLPPVELGEVMRGGVAGHVIASRDPAFAPGDAVTGILGVQEYAVAPADELTRVDESIAPLPVHVSALGVPGVTAYFGLLEVGEAKPGDRVVISAAGGAVGTMAGQIAKLHGCKVIGIAGGERKCRFLVEELGFDAAIDYRNEDVSVELRRHVRRGINVYFDNVGGPILDVALTHLARRARVVVCGAIAQYNEKPGAFGLRNHTSLIVNRASMRGMLVFDYEARYAEATDAIRGWLDAGRLRPVMDIVDGFERFPEALRRLFDGANLGKQMLRMTDSRDD